MDIIPIAYCGKNNCSFTCNQKATSNSLKYIKYVNDRFEKNFQLHGISDLQSLIDYAGGHSPMNVNNLLQNVFINSNGSLNGKAFNNTLMFLQYKNDISNN